jgi:fructose-1-phosphate kinase PfkB-like protein
MTEMCHADGVIPDWVETEADTRFCLNVLHGNGEKTEIIEDGAPLEFAAATMLLEKWRQLLPKARLAAIGGSYAPFSDARLQWHAAMLCDLAAQADVPVIYDGVDMPFRRALASKSPPWAIKPNLEEAATLLGRTIETPADERRAVRDLRRKGAEIVLLSCGACGLYAGWSGGIEWFAAPRVETVSAVGAGDSLVGAFAAKWLETGDVFEAARWGVAAGSASAAQEKPAFVSRDEAAALMPQVRHETREIALHSA